MSGSGQHDRVALVSADDQAIIGRIVNRNLLEVNFGERQTLLEEAQEVLRRVAEYTEPADMIQTVSDHPVKIIELQKLITDLQDRQFLPPQCNHTEMETRIRGLENDLAEARTRHRADGTDEQLREDLLAMTQDVQQFGEEVRSLRTQLANALMLAARTAPAAPQAPEDRGQKF